MAENGVGMVAALEADNGTRNIGSDSSALQQKMMQLCTGYCVTQMIHVVAQLRIADELADSALTGTELATAVGCDARFLERLLRALSTLELFTERPDGRFELTPLGSTLRSDAPEKMRLIALSYGASWWWRAYGRMLECVRTGMPAFFHEHGTDLFSFLEKDPGASVTFFDNMDARTSAESQAIVAAYDFANAGHVVDLGGGQGVLAGEILRSAPRTKATILDRPSLKDLALAYIGQQNLHGRCDFMEGNFFNEIPDLGDTYCLKYILHDWDDDTALRILRSCRRAITGEKRLLIFERLIDKSRMSAADAVFDISMMAIVGGMERSEEEYRALLSAAGFTTRAVFRTSGAVQGIEAIQC